VLRGLTSALEDQRQSSLETPEIAQQRANILGHGTIETPQDYNYRTANRNAADVINPASPIGAAGALQHSRELDKAQLAPGGVAATQVAGQNALGVEGIKRQTALDESGDRLAGSMYNSDTQGEAKLESELANQIIGAKFTSDIDRQTAVKGFLDALNLLRRNGGRGPVQMPAGAR
jgi:hypothetical protein